METLRRRLRIGIIGKRKINNTKARGDLLATHVWREEATRIEEEEEEVRQKESRTKQTGARTTEQKGSNEKDQENIEVERKTWETKQASKDRANKTLKEMGFNGEPESNSRGERIRKKEQNQKK